MFNSETFSQKSHDLVLPFAKGYFAGDAIKRIEQEFDNVILELNPGSYALISVTYSTISNINFGAIIMKECSVSIVGEYDSLREAEVEKRKYESYGCMLPIYQNEKYYHFYYILDSNHRNPFRGMAFGVAAYAAAS